MVSFFKSCVRAPGEELKRLLSSLTFATAVGLSAFSAPLHAITPAHHPLEHVPLEQIPTQLLVDSRIFDQRGEIVAAIYRTVDFLQTDAGQKMYASFGNKGLDVRLMQQSIEHFAYLLLTCKSHHELVDRVRSSFDLYRSTGNDGRGTVKFTGYFRPVYRASRTQSSEYPYPLFRLPPDYSRWGAKHPTRVELEGYNGKGGTGTRLKGMELAWVRTRFEAFMIHVQGSSVLEFPDGTKEAIGFAGATEYPFRGISADFLKKNKVAWGKLGDFFSKHPAKLDELLSKNNRFIFFSEQHNSDPIGSLGVPVVEERSIAIDQGKLPPGAISIIRTALPRRDNSGKLKMVDTSRFVLNLDSGSAIKGPGRVDVFMGTGEDARERANSVFGLGQLYYLVVKPELIARKHSPVTTASGVGPA